MGLIIITGSRDSGKTTYLRSYIHEAIERGERVSGIITIAVGNETGSLRDRKCGYDIIDVHSGESCALLRDRSLFPSFPGQQVGRFTMDEEAMGWAQHLLIKAILDRPDIIVIDELGQLESAGGGYLPVDIRLLNEYKGTIVLVIRSSILNDLLKTLGVDEEGYTLIRIDSSEEEIVDE